MRKTYAVVPENSSIMPPMSGTFSGLSRRLVGAAKGGIMSAPLDLLSG